MTILLTHMIVTRALIIRHTFAVRAIGCGYAEAAAAQKNSSKIEAMVCRYC